MVKMQTAKSRTTVFACLGATSAILVIAGFLVLGSNGILNPDSTRKPYPIESLNQIVPGQTSLRDALAILGEPDSVEDSSYHSTRMFDNAFETVPAYRVYIFRRRDGWLYTELWVKQQGFNKTIVAVLRDLPEAVKGFNFDAFPPLKVFAIQYGHPDEILWSLLCYSRYLIWPDQGVAVDATIPTPIMRNGLLSTTTWDELIVSTIFLFQPTDFSEIRDISQWLWPNNGPGWLLSNPCKEYKYPQDPFDWESLPTPVP